MGRRGHQRLSLAGSGSPNGGKPGAAPVQSRKTALKHVLTAWISAIVLAVNLFGWTLTSLPEAPSLQPSADMAMMAAFDGALLCEHAAGHDGDHGNGQGTDHGKMVCPACFPLGNASSGALVCVPPAVLVSVESLLVERIRPGDRTAPSSFVPHRYQARAPPQFA